MTRWQWGLVIVVLVPLSALLGLLLWWWLCERQQESAILTLEAEDVVPAPVRETPAREAKPVPSASSDLKRIWGIGPKISSVLQEAGIATYTQLAEAEVSRLEGILRAAGIKLADPSTWPEQARLAAAGRWDALKALQGELRGGRRV